MQIVIEMVKRGEITEAAEFCERFGWNLTTTSDGEWCIVNECNDIVCTGVYR